MKKFLVLFFVAVLSSILYFYGNQANANKTSSSEIIKSESTKEVTDNSKSIQDQISQANDDTNSEIFYDSDLVEGNRNAKVVIIEYFALTCPHCAYFHKNIYPELKKKYIDTNKIAFVHREFVGSKQDLEAAVLARCAGNIKKKAFYDVLLDQQSTWAFNRNFSQILTNIGQVGGVSPERYQTCLKDENLATILMNNTKLISRTPGFVGTPAFIINNKIYNDSLTIESLSKKIDSLL